LLPVYNCPQYVGVAIESILAQTFNEFELLILDDGSTDETPEVIKKYNDSRIRKFRHPNRGLAGTLNVGIQYSRGEFIARQDQDDVSHPERLSKQVEFLERHPLIGLVGTWAQIIEGDWLVERYHRHPSEPEELRYALLFNNPFVHSSVMLRKSVLDAVGGYSTDRDRQPPEDFELWSRLARQAEVANLPEELLHYREIPGSMSRAGPSPFRNHLVRICIENIAHASGAPENDPQLVNIAALSHGAVEMVLCRPNFARMREILLAAAESICTERTRETLRRSASDHVQALRGLHFANKALLGRLVFLKGPVRNFLKYAYWSLQTLSRRIATSGKSLPNK